MPDKFTRRISDVLRDRRHQIGAGHDCQEAHEVCNLDCDAPAQSSLLQELLELVVAPLRPNDDMFGREKRLCRQPPAGQRA